MENQGYIKIYRKIQDNFIYLDSQAVHLWIHLILKANHSKKEFMFNGKKEVLEIGQLITSREKISSETNINSSKVYRLLKILEREQLIKQQMNNRFTKIIVLNYKKYQSHLLKSEQQTKQQVNNKRTTSEQQVNTNNNEENDNNDNNIYIPPTPLKSGDSKILQLTNHQKVINCYLETKNGMPFSLLPKETIASGYRRFGRTASSLLKDTSNNVDLICKAIRYLPIWAKAKGLDWSLETVSKAIAEPRSFKLNKNEIQTTENERKLVKGFLLLNGWQKDKLKQLDITKDKYTLSLLEPAKKVLSIFKNDLDIAYSKLKSYKENLKDGKDFSLHLFSIKVFEQYGGRDG